MKRDAGTQDTRHRVLGVAARGALVLLVLLALTPLVVDKGVLFPYVTAKALAIRAVVALASVLVLIEMAWSREFRASVAGKVAQMGRNPVALSVAAVVVALIVSTIGAVNQDRAFYGDLERGEGLIGLVPIFGFFFLVAILFERRDWIRFFQLTMACVVVLFVHAILQRMDGVLRPGSFTGHPAYLGPYCFFVIAAAIFVAAEAKTRPGKALALGAIPVAVATLLLSGTRAAMLGFVVGVVAVLVLIAVRGARPGDARGRRAAMVLLGCLMIASATFFATRRASVWQSIPGVQRVANYQPNDLTTQWRLGVWEASLRAASPNPSGWRRVWFGWGMENFHVPFNRDYHPTRFAYDPSFYDRSHNVLIDTLVMSGVFGLAAHLTMWAAFIAAALRRSRPLPEQAALLFTGLAYFVQNLVSFDSFSTYVPLFGLLAYTVATSTEDSTRRVSASAAMTLVGALALFSVYSLFAHTIPAYRQVRRYVGLYKHSRDIPAMLAEWNRIRSPYTYAQPAIRTEFLPSTRVLLRRDRATEPLLVAAIGSMEEVAERDSLNPRHLLSLSEAIGEYADATGKAELHRTAEARLKRALALAPGRRHVRNALTINQWRQRCEVHHSVCYYQLLARMTGAKNIEGATLVRERLELLDPPRRPMLKDLGRLVQEAKWDSIRINVSGNNVSVTLGGKRP